MVNQAVKGSNSTPYKIFYDDLTMLTFFVSDTCILFE